MINLNEILTTLYPDKSLLELEILLKQLNLHTPFKSTTAQLNSILTNEKKILLELKALPVGHIVANLLVAINTKLQTETNLIKKKEYEAFLSSLCYQILSSFLMKSAAPKESLFKMIAIALTDTCSFYNYDFNQLSALFIFGSLVAFKRSMKTASKIIPLNQTPAFRWQGNSNQLKEFITIFSEQKLMTSKKGLSQLFNYPDAQLNIQFDPGKADLTLQFFYTLKKIKLLSWSGSKGFYEVLVFHLLDFEETFLKNKTPKVRINTLQQSKKKWAENQIRIDKWLRNFAVPQT